MTVYREWHDVVYYNDTNIVKTEAQRLDVSKAVRFQSRSPLEYLKVSYEQIEKFGVVLDKNDVVQPGDMFEAMEILSGGRITIWTKRYVFSIIRDGGIEKWRRFDRNPPEGS